MPDTYIEVDNTIPPWQSYHDYVQALCVEREEYKGLSLFLAVPLTPEGQTGRRGTRVIVADSFGDRLDPKVRRFTYTTISVHSLEISPGRVQDND